jgi:large subunit ribosomal protein L37Ae
MARRTRKAGSVARFGPRYGVRIRRRVQEIDEGLRRRHTCPRCAAISVRRESTGVWACRRCGYVFAGGAYRPIVTTSFKREIQEAKEEPEAKAEEV